MEYSIEIYSFLIPFCYELIEKEFKFLLNEFDIWNGIKEENHINSLKKMDFFLKRIFQEMKKKTILYNSYRIFF